MSVQIEIIDAYSNNLNKIEKESLNLNPVMEVVPAIVANAIDTDFDSKFIETEKVLRALIRSLRKT